MGLEHNVTEFWDGILSRTVMLRFKVTDREQALATIGQLQRGQFDPLPGLSIAGLDLFDASERSRECLRALRDVMAKYAELG